MLSQSSKYAIKALLQLAVLDTDEYMQVRTLARTTRIPGPYLSKLIKTLANRGIVETRRGSSGGVRLPTTKSRISFFDICQALEDPVLKQGCFFTVHACNAKDPCAMHRHGPEFKNRIVAFLKEKKNQLSSDRPHQQSFI